MVTIKEFLTPGERVMKKEHGSVEKGAAGIPVGGLCSANTQLFLMSKSAGLWVLPTASPSLIRPGSVQVRALKIWEQDYCSSKTYIKEKRWFFMKRL